MVMGADRGMELVERLPQVEAVLVDEAGATKMSRGLEGRLEVRHAPRR
jgi:thiamine biosynthesis lipoprotein ApbE